MLVEDIELGAGAGVEAFLRKAEGLDTLDDAGFLAVHGLARLEEAGDGLLDIEDGLADAVIVIDLRLLEAGFRGFDIAVGEEPVPDGPGAGDSEEPALDHVGEVGGEEVALVRLGGLGVDLREVAGDLLVHAGGLAEDELALGFEVGVARDGGADGFVGIDVAGFIFQFADDIERDLGGEAGRVVHSEESDEAIHGDAVGVFCLDERGLGVGEGDFGLEDIEARDGAGLVAVLLVFELLGEEVHGLLVRDDEGAIENDFEEVGFDLGDDGVDDGAEAVVGFDFIGDRGADARDGGAAIVDELGEFDIDGETFVVGRGAEVLDGLQFRGGVAVVRLQRDLGNELGADGDEATGGGVEFLDGGEDFGILADGGGEGVADGEVGDFRVALLGDEGVEGFEEIGAGHFLRCGLAGGFLERAAFRAWCEGFGLLRWERGRGFAHDLLRVRQWRRGGHLRDWQWHGAVGKRRGQRRRSWESRVGKRERRDFGERGGQRKRGELREWRRSGKVFELRRGCGVLRVECGGREKNGGEQG